MPTADWMSLKIFNGRQEMLVRLFRYTEELQSSFTITVLNSFFSPLEKNLIAAFLE